MAKDSGIFSIGVEVDNRQVLDFEKHITELERELTSGVHMEIDTSGALRAMKKLGESTADFGQALRGEDASARFHLMKKELQELEAVQQDALATMILTGRDGSAAYQEVQASLMATRAELDRVAQAEREVSAGFEAPRKRNDAEQFEDTKRALQELEAVQAKTLAQMRLTGREGSEAYQEVEASLVETRAELGRVAEAEQEVAAGAQEVRDNMAELEKLARRQIIADGMAKAGEALSEFGDIGVGIEKQMKLISAQTGKTGSDLDDLRARAEAAFKQGIGESLQEALEIASSTDSLLGNIFDPGEMELATERIGQLAAVTGAAPEEIAGKMRTLVQAFPELQKDAAKAFDLIALGAQKAKTPQDDFLDTIAEYSPNFKDAGFSAEQALSSMINASEAGAFNLDKVGDAIKELGIRATEGDITTELETAFKDFGDRVPQQLQEKMLDVGSALERGLIDGKTALTTVAQAVESSDIDEKMQLKLIRAFAGTPAEDLGKDIGLRVFTNLVPDDVIREQAAAAGEQIDAALTPAGGFQEFKREIEVLKTKAAELVGPYAQATGEVATQIGTLAPGFLAVSDRVTELGGKAGLLSKLGTAASGLGGSIGSLGKSFGALATGPVGIIAGIAAVLVLAYQNSESFRTAIDGLLSTLGEAFAPLLEQLGSLLSRLLESLSPLLGAVGDLAGTLLTALEPILGVVIEVLGELFGIIGEVAGVVVDVLTPVLGVLADAISFVAGIVGDLIAILVDGLFSALEWIASFIVDVFLAAWDGIVAAANFVWNAIKKVIGVYVSFYKKIFDVVKAIGSFIAEVLGVGDAIDSMIGWVGDAIGAVGDFIGSLFGAGNAIDQMSAKAEALNKKQAEAAAKNRKIVAGGTADFVKGLAATAGAAANQAHQAGQEIPRRTAGGMKSGAAKAAKTVKEAAEDFTDVWISSMRTAADTRRKLNISLIEDEWDQIEEDSAFRLELLDRGIDDELGKIDERIAKLAAKKKEGYKTEIIKEVEARAALEEKREALHEEAANEELKRLEELARKKLDLKQKETDRLLALEDRRQTLIRDLADRETIAGLEQATAAELDLLKNGLDRELRTLAEATPEYQKAADEIAEAVASGFVTIEQAEVMHQAARHHIIETGLKESGSLYSLLTQQHAAEERRLTLESIRRRAQLQEEGLRAENAGYRALLAVRDNLYKGFYTEVDVERQRDLKNQLKAIEEEKRATVDRFRLELIGRDEVRTQMEEIGAREKEILEELGVASKSFVDQLTEGLGLALGAVGETLRADLDSALSDINTLLFATEEEIAALDLKAGDLNAKMLDVAEQGAIQIIALTAQQAAAGDNILKSFAQNSLDMMLQLLVAESKAIVALIFGKSVAANPILGTVIAAGLIATFAALTSAAKAELSGAEFFDAGYTGDGNPRDIAGRVHKKEFVFDHVKTGQHRPFFETVHGGVHPLLAALDHYGPVRLPRFSSPSSPELVGLVRQIVADVAHGQSSGRIRQLEVENRRLQDQNAELVDRMDKAIETLDKLARAYKVTNYHHFEGKLDVDEGRMVAKLKEREYASVRGK